MVINSVHSQSHRILVEVYSKHTAERMCHKYLARGKSGEFGLEDDERLRRLKKFEKELLEGLPKENCCKRITRRIFASHSSIHFKT